MIISSSWGVLVARHKQVRPLGEELFSRGIDHFIPKIETLLIRHGRHEREQRPMLGDYVLIAICSAWKSLLAIKNVSGIILNADGYPAQVLPSELDMIRNMCDSNGVYHPDGETKENEIIFQYGQKVTPKSGPFSSKTGRYEGKSKRGDIALFSLFGREQRYEFKPGDLIAV